MVRRPAVVGVDAASLVRHHLTEILVLAGVGKLLEGARRIGPIEVAERNDFKARLADLRQLRTSNAANADAADGDAVGRRIGAQNGVGDNGGGRTGGNHSTKKGFARHLRAP